MIVYANDSVVESIELMDKNMHPFAIGVQWHPEGLEDEASKAIGKLFLDQVKIEK